MSAALKQTKIYNPAIYDRRHAARTADIDFYVTLARRFGGPVLDLCCGTGRITIPIARQGIDVTGLDIKPALVGHARDKAEAAGLKVEWVMGDATRFQLGRQFQLILVSFNSLEQLGREPQLRSFFECVRAHLKPGGVLAFDVRNPDLREIVSGRRSGRQYADPETGEQVSTEWSIDYDDAEQISLMTCHFSTRSRPDFATDRLEVRAFYPAELNLLVRAEGFAILEKLGGYDGRPFQRGCVDQIVLATRMESP